MEKKENKFSLLCEILMDKLGCDFNIKYYVNSFKSWSDILIGNDKMVVGALKVTDGQSLDLESVIQQFDNISIGLVIPAAEPTFTNVMNQIDNIMPTLKNYQFNQGDDLYSFSYRSRTDGSKLVINGDEYALVTLIGGLLSFQNLVLSRSRKITINKQELKGVINATWGSQKTTDGEVLGLKTPIQSNDINGIQLSLNVEIIPLANNELHTNLLRDDNKIRSYEVSYHNGIFERKNNMVLLSNTESTPAGGKLTAQLVFVIGG